MNSVCQALLWEGPGFEANSLPFQIVESPEAMAGLSRVLLPMLMASLELAWSGKLTAQGSDGDLRVDHDHAECTADEGQSRPCPREHDSIVIWGGAIPM